MQKILVKYVNIIRVIRQLSLSFNDSQVHHKCAKKRTELYLTFFFRRKSKAKLFYFIAIFLANLFIEINAKNLEKITHCIKIRRKCIKSLFLPCVTFYLKLNGIF